MGDVIHDCFIGSSAKRRTGLVSSVYPNTRAAMSQIMTGERDEPIMMRSGEASQEIPDRHFDVIVFLGAPIGHLLHRAGRM